MAWQWSDSVWHEPDSLYLYRKIGFGWFKFNLAKNPNFAKKKRKNSISSNISISDANLPL
jgi:hypothetical protein